MEEPAGDKRVWGLSKNKYWKFVSGFLALIFSAIFLYNTVLWAAGSSFFSNLFSEVGDATNQFKLVGQIVLDNYSRDKELSARGGESSEVAAQNQFLEKSPQELVPEDGAVSGFGHKIVQPTINTTSTIRAAQKTEIATSSGVEEIISPAQAPPTGIFQQCSFTTSSQLPTHQKLIINEIAWMGTGESAANEWIELKNISGGAIDLTDWQLLDKDEQIKINLGLMNNAKLGAGGFVILERTDDATVPNIAADFIYAGALSNSDESLRLFDSQCNLVDEVSANPDWPAGNNTEKKTMERDISGFGWRTSSVVGGTPKRENSLLDAVYSSGGSGGEGVISSQSSGNILPQFYPVVINEIMYDISGADEGREWIEIFNSGSQPVDLTNWKFYENQTNHSLTLGQGSMSLLAGGYAVIASDPDKFLVDHPGYNGTILKSSFSLSNAGETIAIKNGDLLIDEVIYSSTLGANGDGKSLQKINNNWLASLPTPGRENQLTNSSNQAPSAFFVYAPSSPIAGETVNFNAGSSTDADRAISVFEWDFGDSRIASTTNLITTHIYTQIGNYVVRLVVFDNGNTFSTPTSTTISIAAGGANHLLISEVYPDKSGNNFDFVELYNPTNASIALSNYSLKIQKGAATSTSPLASFSSGHNIAAKSFFLVGLDKYQNSTSTTADVVRSSYFLPTTETATIFLLNGETVVDQVNYNPSNFSTGQSLERTAYENNQCVSAQGSGEFLGNGCDTDNVSDFEIRVLPNPQNSVSALEP